MSTRKTGWEALDQHIAGGGGSAAPAEPGEAKKTGWEALDKWVGPDGAPAEPAAPGSAAPPPAPGTASGHAPGGGFLGWLKRLFGGA